MTELNSVIINRLNINVVNCKLRFLIRFTPVNVGRTLRRLGAPHLNSRHMSVKFTTFGLSLATAPWMTVNPSHGIVEVFNRWEWIGIPRAWFAPGRLISMKFTVSLAIAPWIRVLGSFIGAVLPISVKFTASLAFLSWLPSSNRPITVDALTRWRVVHLLLQLTRLNL